MTVGIVLIDFQNDFKHIINDVLLQNIRDLIKNARNHKFIIIWVHAEYDVLTDNVDNKIVPTHSNARKKLCVKGSLGIEFIQEIKDLMSSSAVTFNEQSRTKISDNDMEFIICKKHYSCFVNSDLQTIISKKHIQELIFAGITTNTCVFHSIQDSLKCKNIFKTTLAIDCTNAVKEKLVMSTCDNIKLLGGQVKTNAELFAEWTHARFGEGDSSIMYDVLLLDDIPSFVDLKNEITWNTMNQHGNAVPRLVAIQGTLYCNNIHINDNNNHALIPLYRHPADEQPELVPWTPLCEKLQKIVSKIMGQDFNHALIQYYRNGEDNIGPHTDKTLDILRGSSIVNLSFGSSRNMTFRKKGDKSKKVKIVLRNNSLLCLGWETNKKWLHAIHPDKRCTKIKDDDEIYNNQERISFTFRSIATFLDTSTGNILGQGASKINNVISTDDIISKDVQRMFECFHTENSTNDFDWDKHYGMGFSNHNVKWKPLIINSENLANIESILESQEQLRIQHSKIIAKQSSIIIPKCSSSFGTIENIGTIVERSKVHFTLYVVNGSIPNWRVLILLYEYKIHCNVKRLFVMCDPRQTKSGEYLKLNPRGVTPTLVVSTSIPKNANPHHISPLQEDDKVLTESWAIMRFVERYGISANDIQMNDIPANDIPANDIPANDIPANDIPANDTLTCDTLTNDILMNEIWSRSKMEALAYSSDDLRKAYKPMEVLFSKECISEEKKEFAKKSLQNVKTELRIWEDHFQKIHDPKAFINGTNVFTFADAAIFPVFAYLVHRGLKLMPIYPNIQRYYDMVFNRESVQMAHPHGWNKIGKVDIFKLCEELQ